MICLGRTVGILRESRSERRRN